MIIKSLILENFRSYRAKTTIPFAQLTAFIGRNDAGKSTILEALDIFFEGGVVKVEPDDASKGGDARRVRIGVVFTGLPPKLVLDSNAETNLAEEYLLNEDGDLEIHKVFDCSIQSPKATVLAQALAPTAPGANGLLQKNRAALQTIVREGGLENACNRTSNPSMRKAIYTSIGTLDLQSREIPLNEENGKAVWQALQPYMPIFSLFQADRPSSDQDPEVQNPMKLAVDQALSGLEDDLNRITGEVQAKAQETADRTLAKLRETYPEIASTLAPKFKKPAWKNIFKMDLEADDGIPLNKRGSGVRRLVLLSFFQAEAERRRSAGSNDEMPRRPVIYAIEEPETSQHPDNQVQIITALRSLAETGDQVVLTTHVPALAALIPLDSLRYIDRDKETGAVRVRSGEAVVYEDIANALGILPDPLAKPGIKVAVLVEGKTDIDALRSMISVLSAANEIPPFDETAVFWTIGGGDSTLMDWVERRYLDKLAVPQVMIQDSDRPAVNQPIDPKKTDWLAEMQARPNVVAFLTRKRCMENYLHPEAVTRQAGCAVLPSNLDYDFSDMAAEFLVHIKNSSGTPGYNFNAIDHEGVLLPTTRRYIKRIICAYIMKHMTAPEIKERANYMENGVTKNEVLEWIEAIQKALAA